MEINVKQFGLALLIVGVSAFWYGKNSVKPEIRTEVQEKEVVKRDIVTVIREILNPDGTKEVVTTITDNTKETKKSSSQTVATDIKVAKDWAIGLNVKSSSLLEKPDYVLSIDRRVLGPFSATISASTDKQFGLGLKMEF